MLDALALTEAKKNIWSMIIITITMTMSRFVPWVSKLSCPHRHPAPAKTLIGKRHRLYYGLMTYLRRSLTPDQLFFARSVQIAIDIFCHRHRQLHIDHLDIYTNTPCYVNCGSQVRTHPANSIPFVARWQHNKYRSTVQPRMLAPQRCQHV